VAPSGLADARLIWPTDDPPVGPQEEPLLWREWSRVQEGPGGLKVERASTSGGEQWRLVFSYDHAHVTFTLAPGGENIRIAYSHGVPQSNVVALIAGPVMGYILKLRQHLVLHANVVDVGGGAIALVGAQSSGKSTTTAALIAGGAALVADDMAVIEPAGSPAGHGWQVHSGSPYLRLCPDVIARMADHGWAAAPLWEPCVGQPPATFQTLRDKYRLAVPAAPTGAFPLLGVYLLGRRRSDLDAPSVRGLRPADRLVALLPQLYLAAQLDDLRQRQIFAGLTQLVCAVPVRVLERPDSLAALPALAEAVLDDARSLLADASS
jgi:hypothetical protein